MSKSICLEPHSDDAVLFSCFNLIRYQPLLVTVLSSAKQDRLGVTQKMREAETVAACVELDLPLFFQWAIPDNNPDWSAVEAGMRSLDEDHSPELVFAPAVEEGGHEDHNAVAEIAVAVFGDRVTNYCTYRRGSLRTRTDTEVPFEPSWPTRKLRAMACYESQIGLPQTLPWFIDDTLREWVA